MPSTQPTGSGKQPRAAGSTAGLAPGGLEPVAVLIRLPDLNRSQTGSGNRGPRPVTASASAPVARVDHFQAAPAAKPHVPADARVGANAGGLVAAASPREAGSAVLEPIQLAGSSASSARIWPRLDAQPFVDRLRRTPVEVWQAGSAAAVVLLILLAIVSIRDGRNGPRIQEDQSVREFSAARGSTDKSSRGAEYSVARLESSDLKVPPPRVDMPARAPQAAAAAQDSPPPPQADEGPPGPGEPAAAESGPDQARPAPAAADAAPPLEPATDPAKADPSTPQQPPGKNSGEQQPVEQAPADPPASAPQDAPPLASPAASPAQAPLDEQSARTAAAAPAATASPAAEIRQPPQDQAARLVTPQYPVTHPATYQYPSDYEQLFREPLGETGAATGAAQDRGSMYPWQPNTARLQPGIEPPPIR